MWTNQIRVLVTQEVSENTVGETFSRKSINDQNSSNGYFYVHYITMEN